jgi:hypothetical protein
MNENNRAKRICRIAIFFSLCVPCLHAQLPFFSFGLEAGVPLNDSMLRTNFPGIETFDSSSRKYIVGPSVELRLPRGLSVEADALFHPFNIRQTIYLSPGGVTVSTYHVFEFPVVAKYRLGGRILDPFIEGGVSFRSHLDALEDVSRHGIALGAGIDIKLRIIRISPALRYTRWGSDTLPSGGIAAPSNQNQAAILVGVSF